MSRSRIHISRRTALVSGAAALVLPMTARADIQDIPMAQQAAIVPPPSRRNVGSFRSIDWRDHFDNLNVATIIADTRSRAMHYWAANDTDYRIYPTSVPMTEELTRRGYTTVVRKKVGPSWTPTPSMIERNPSLRAMPPGPDNPLGTHAMYLGWPAYIIHGTHDTRKIGRRSSDGCIGTFNEKIEELFDLCPIGTQVKIL